MKKQRGTLIVEFILLLPTMIFMIFLSVYLGMVFHDYNALNEVARETARYGVVGTNTDANVQSAAHTRANNLITGLYTVPLDSIVLSRGTDKDLNDEKYLEVTVTANKVDQTSTGMINEILPNTLKAKVRMRVELDPKAEDPKKEDSN